MSVVHTPESEYAKEMRKWEAQYTEFGPPGRPYVYQEYPMQLYRAARRPNGGGHTFDGQRAETERERSSLEALGFVAGGQQCAVDVLETQERQYAELAASREYAVRHGKHSEAAVREIRDAEAVAGAVHLPDVDKPERRGVGRPKKKVAVA